MILKIGTLFSNYGPYHLARLESLVKLAQYSHLEISALELARSEEEYPWVTELEKYNFSVISVIKNKTLEKTHTIELLLKLNKILDKLNLDVIAISGYFNPAMLFALMWCLWHGKRAILFSESTEADAPRIWWREMIKQWIVARYKAALVGGHPHKRYLMQLGMSESAIFLGYDVVDNDTFRPERIENLSRPIAKPYFLAINRFVNKKNLPFLISAYGNYRQKFQGEPWDLIICGDGELRPLLEKQITDSGIDEFIHLPGFLQQEELLPYFAHAGCFIHASRQEQWGLVVNEAMAAGLPVLVSDRCGCFEDLILEGINGFGFDPENLQQLVSLMTKISSKELDLQAMEKASLHHIQEFSPDHFARRLLQAIEYATTH
ncbi:MAG: UDP-N-acetylglucosamine--peptide N-acetylglucosaminyltransferase GtfA subunit [Chroococcopsis gigantea SAG 12.99]|jgi:1,2-diacylglycerol 3-alpha-glucosyltransferase|nr:glycosyltransferase family 4 protein [Chlorogloea purpurea SAG 13.99]MDV2998467.1 UDP-N-acetylglucosamine--peptide N-acetylglucosaminyltransferase GtfA subunit [Chroococcopsis gigantea SAG 12.99]